MMMHSLLAMAQPASSEQEDPRALVIKTIAMLAFFGAIFYFIMIRPQQKQRKEQENLLKNLRTGDKVLMSNGIFGIIANVKEKAFVVKIADNVKVEVVKSAVTAVVQKGDDSADTSN